MAGEEVVVADATVIVKWFTDKEHTGDALRAMDNHVDMVVDVASLGVVMDVPVYTADKGLIDKVKHPSLGHISSS